MSSVSRVLDPVTQSQVDTPTPHQPLFTQLRGSQVLKRDVLHTLEIKNIAQLLLNQ